METLSKSLCSLALVLGLVFPAAGQNVRLGNVPTTNTAQSFYVVGSVGTGSNAPARLLDVTTLTQDRPAWPQSHSDDVPLVIYDVNMASDIEDAGSVALAASLHRYGRIRLLTVAVGASSDTNHPVVSATRALLAYYGAGEVPISAYDGEKFGNNPLYTNSYYTSSSFPRIIVTNASARGLAMFDNPLTYTKGVRKALASAPTNSVWFCVNQPFNPLLDFLTSTNDEFSPLTGQALAAQKVKAWVIMAGDYPNSTNPAGLAGEYNFLINPTAATNVYTRLAGQRIYWTGFSIGTTPKAAYPGHLRVYPEGWTNAHLDSPNYNLAALSENSGDVGRYAWASAGLIFAAFGTNAHGKTLFTYQHTGTNNISSTTGSNWWSGTVDAGQAYMASINTNAVQSLIRYYTEEQFPVRLGASNLWIFGTSTNAATIGNSALIVNTLSNQVTVGENRLISESKAQASRLEVVSTPATTNTTVFDPLLTLAKPVNAGTVWPQAARWTIGRLKPVSSFSADTVLRQQVKDSANEYLDETGNWNTVADWHKTNLWIYTRANIPTIKANAGSVSECSYGFTNNWNCGIYDPGSGTLGLVAGGTEFLRGYEDDMYFQSGGVTKWVSGSLGSSSPDTGLARSSAGMLEINNGNAGTIRDLRTRNVILESSTSHPTVTSSQVGLWNSNGILYGVTATATNALW